MLRYLKAILTVCRLSYENLSRFLQHAEQIRVQKWVEIDEKFAQYHYKMVEDVTARHTAPHKCTTILHRNKAPDITNQTIFSNGRWT
jgi:hypothetical protein